jgi:hypothetical protein
MYQPYPGSATMPEAQRPSAPDSVRRAVYVMYAGAAATLIFTIVDLATLSTTKSNIEKHMHHLTTAAAARLGTPLIIDAVVGGLITAALWVFVARACGNGKSWARVTGTVFFAIGTVDMVGYLALPFFAAAVRIVVVVIWLIGLAAVVLLWRRSSSAFFKEANGARP